MNVITAVLYSSAVGGAAAAPMVATASGMITPQIGAIAMMVVAVLLLLTVDPKSN